MRVIQVGINSWKKSNQARWITAHACAQVTAGRVPGMTQQAYAVPLGVTRQYVSRLARAWVTYATLRAVWLADERVQERYLHPFTYRTAPHISTEIFTELGEAWKRHDLTVYDLFSLLETAYNDHLSPENMRLLIDESESEGRPLWWEYLQHVNDYAVKLSGQWNAPEEIKQAAQGFVDVARPVLGKGAGGWR